MITELLRIKECVEKAEGAKAQNLASAINKRTLAAAHKIMDGKKATGIDGISKDEYGAELDSNLGNLVSRMTAKDLCQPILQMIEL